MQSSLIVAALLCFTTWMTPISCCVTWSKARVSLDRIVSYAIQSEDTCRIKAVQLRTVLGKTICANPNADWTRKAMEWVDRENSQKGFASDMTPTTSTASPASGNIPQKDKETGEKTKRGKKGKNMKRLQICQNQLFFCLIKPIMV
uniref:Chemokine interleukin-8-like domain-containing protein n=1 Tax=Astatotilapia calliptera TaxID=8154 RepID=A0A3P8NLM0_ASTCA